MPQAAGSGNLHVYGDGHIDRQLDRIRSSQREQPKLFRVWSPTYDGGASAGTSHSSNLPIRVAIVRGLVI
jgi:hypothetical protein